MSSTDHELSAAVVDAAAIGSPGELDPEIEAMKQRILEMEEEAVKLRELHAAAQEEMNAAVEEDKEEVDSRSVYVGNVDYGSSPEELQAHFQSCGTINRITILCDKFTGHPKGFAYVEFAEQSAVLAAIALDESLFRGRILKITQKRTNVPGMKLRGGYSRGAGGARPYRGGYRGRGRGGRRGYYTPY